MLQSSGSSERTGGCRMMENCSINELSIGIINAIVSDCTAKFESLYRNTCRNIHNTQTRKKEKADYPVHSTHWPQDRNAGVDYWKSFCAQRFFIQLLIKNRKSWNEVKQIINAILIWIASQFHASSQITNEKKKHIKPVHSDDWHGYFKKKCHRNSHEGMIKLYSSMGKEQGLILEPKYHPNHQREELNILKLHELQGRMIKTVKQP